MKILIIIFSAVAIIFAAELRDEILWNDEVATLKDGILFNGKASADDWFRNKKDKIIEGIYLSPLDHFTPTNSLRLNLHYTVNVQFFKEGGPLFFQTHFDDSFGDGNLHLRGLVYDLAREQNGALVKASFRYMGNNFFGYESNNVRIIDKYV